MQYQSLSRCNGRVTPFRDGRVACPSILGQNLGRLSLWLSLFSVLYCSKILRFNFFKGFKKRWSSALVMRTRLISMQLWDLHGVNIYIYFSEAIDWMVTYLMDPCGGGWFCRCLALHHAQENSNSLHKINRIDKRVYKKKGWHAASYLALDANSALMHNLHS